MTRVTLHAGFYVKKDGPDSYWLCHKTDESGDHHASCMRIDYHLFKELIAWRSRPKVWESPKMKPEESRK